MQNLHKEIEIFPFHNNQIPNSNVLSFYWTLFHSKLMKLGFQIQCFHCSTVSMNIYEEPPKLHVPHIQNLYTVVPMLDCFICTTKYEMHALFTSFSCAIKYNIFFSTVLIIILPLKYHSTLQQFRFENDCQTHLHCKTLQLCVFFLLYYFFVIFLIVF